MYVVQCNVHIMCNTFQADLKKNKDNLGKLNEAIDLMERHLEEQKKSHERLIAAEITSRFLCIYVWFSSLEY